MKPRLDPLDPLDPELAALLEAERSATPAAAALERVWSRVVGGVVPPTGGGPGAGRAGAGSGSGWLASNAVSVAAATFVVGAVVGASLHAVLQAPAPERVVYVERPAAPIAMAPPPPASSLAPETPPPSPTALPTASLSVPSAHASARAAPSSSGSSLQAERALLDDARSALGSHDAAAALTLLADHDRRFPRGQLGEEREALAIQALVMLGRNDEARARAAHFRATSPNSLFLPAVDAALASIP